MPSIYLNQSPPPVFWLSPALSVVRNSGPNSGLVDVAYTDLNPAVNPQVARGVAGCDGGGQATGVKVQLWACAFGTAPASNLFLPSLGGTAGITAPAGNGLAISSPLTQAFDQPWDRDSGLIASEVRQFANAAGDVHACLYGNVFADGQGGPRTSVAVGPDPFDPAGNRRHAQRNTTIRAAPPGKLMPMKMWAGNPEPKKGEAYEFQVIERPPRELMVWEVEQIAAAQPWLVAVKPRRALTLRELSLRNLGRGLRTVPSTVTRFVGLRSFDERLTARELPGLQALVDGRRVPLLAPREPLVDLALEIDGHRSDRRQTIKLDADEARASTLHFQVPDEDFVLRVVDVVQRTKEGIVAGGARIVLVAAPAEVTKGLR